MIVRTLLFLSSYSPLFAILAVRFQPIWLKIALMALAICGILALILIFSVSRRSRLESGRKVSRVENSGAAASAYLAGYILPFIAEQSPTCADLLAYLLFGIVAFAVNSKTGLIQVNPLIFMIPGRSIVRVLTESNESLLIIAKGRVRAGDVVRLQPIGGEDIYVMRDCQ